jgi:predicted regulator of Ras-like GTPase activity (Roadblock/LC7/MglB family)
MVDNPLGDFFISDADDEPLDEGLVAGELVVPLVEQPASYAPVVPAPVVPAPVAAPAPVPVRAEPAEVVSQPQAVAAAPVRETREDRLALALNHLMEQSREIDAAALVSLDGFTMASALPDGVHEDRVGAMSAAILGLGERAAAELGRGQLSQVFIEGDEGYVMLIAAGNRAVLTCLAGINAKLGLVLFDMRTAAERIAEILG